MHITRFLIEYGVLALLCLSAWWLAGRRSSRSTWFWIWLGALVFRGISLSAAPELSDDIYRYIWDGRVALEGLNPYRYSPLAPEVAFLRNDLWASINNPHLVTIYPPVLQGVFALSAWVSPTVLGFKTVFTLFDMGAGLFLLLALRSVGRAHWAVLYLWHPAVVLEFSGQGHADAVGLFFLSLALYAWSRQRTLAAGGALSAAALVKFFPLAALPALVPRLRAKGVLILLGLLAAYLPFSLQGVNPLGSLTTFAADWRANAFVFELLDYLPGHWPRVVSVVPALLVLGWAAWRGWDWPRAYVWTVGVLLLCSPVVHPWYVLWLLPAALWCGPPAWVLWCFLAPLSYWVLPGYLATGVWAEAWWVKLVVYGPVMIALGIGRGRGRE